MANNSNTVVETETWLSPVASGVRHRDKKNSYHRPQ